MAQADNKIINFIKKRLKMTLATIVVSLIVAFYFCLPNPLFKDSCSTTLYDRDGTLLGAMIAPDGQWRFPKSDSVPIKFQKAIIQFEDKHFYYHLGVNPVSIIKALIHNISSKNTRGGSTITMQTIRLARKGQARTIPEKLIEAILATRLELGTSKEAILNLYASNAPFGGNVVGLEAASWRYFGREPAYLSWGETAMLAVLPNAPSLIHPGKNRDLLIAKRNRLLHKLYKSNSIDSLTYISACAEEIPDKPHPLPQYAPHLLVRGLKDGNFGKSTHSTISLPIQKHANRIVSQHVKKLRFNDIHNSAVLIMSVKTGDVVAYVGNTPDDETIDHGNDVDIITSNRSTGSILKPFLFAGMLDAGDILPYTLVDDIPTHIAGYSPKNYSLKYNGAVAARMALARSLNIPSVKMLREYRVPKFINLLNQVGLSTINKSADHYGLTLILGGAETNLWEVCGAYASMARSLNQYIPNSSKYSLADYHPPNYRLSDSFSDKKDDESNLVEKGILNAASIYHTYSALLYVNRPQNETGWQHFASSQKIAWKTGTSFGNRDAWAIGFTPEYVVGVWVGNADGEGRPEMTGVGSAAPILFDLFKVLPLEKLEFDLPYDDLAQVEICKQSGYRPSPNCHDLVKKWIPKSGLKTKPCPYHELYHFEPNLNYRVNSECQSVDKMVHKSWFVLPPVQEWYYKVRNPSYKNLPPLRSDCFIASGNPLEFIYPHHNTIIYVPKDFDGQRSAVVFEVAHRNREQKLFWHIDDQYVGQSHQFHKIQLNPTPGKHTLTVVDEQGNQKSIQFEVVER